MNKKDKLEAEEREARERAEEEAKAKRNCRYCVCFYTCTISEDAAKLARKFVDKSLHHSPREIGEVILKIATICNYYTER